MHVILATAMASHPHFFTGTLFCLSVIGFPFVMSDDHIVGANHGWQVPLQSGVNLNYSEWASNQTFHVGDFISFHYQKNVHSVYEVSYSTYVSCSLTASERHSWMYNWSTKGGRTIVLLNETRPYYFACALQNHCQQGMKLAVLHVLPHNNSTINFTPSRNTSSTSHASTSFLKINIQAPISLLIHTFFFLFFFF